VLLCLSGPLIFGAAKAITRQQNDIAEARSLVVDLTDVPHLGVTTSLAIEGAVRDAVAHGCRVYFAGMQEQPKQAPRGLGVGKLGQVAA
jgi:SulP family sulfate permease